MAYYKVVEISKKYSVSQKTIYEWINNAILGKNNLQIEKTEKGLKILITPNNEIKLARLANEGKKFNNSKTTKKTKPSLTFYELFDQEETIEIINDFQFKKEIKHKFMYKKAHYWDSFYLQNGPISTLKVAELIENSFDQIKYYLKDKEGCERDGWILKLMGVDIDLTDIEIYYNSYLNCKEKCFVMDKNYEIEFDLLNMNTKVLLEKGDRISTWRHSLVNKNLILQELEKSGLKMLFMSVDDTDSFAIVICKAN